MLILVHSLIIEGNVLNHLMMLKFLRTIYLK